MTQKLIILLTIYLYGLHGFSQAPEKVSLYKHLPEGFEINSLSLTSDGAAGFFTASMDWEKQLPYLVSFGQDTIVKQIMELDTIYNGAISPSGRQLIYCVRGEDYTTIFLTRKIDDTWTSPVNLSESTGITGGYFHWYSETKLYFYTPDNNGDLASAQLQDNELTISNRFKSLNTEHTEFSPFMGPNKSYLLFTRYVEGDPSQQGIMMSKNIGTSENPQWSIPEKIKGLPYGWGAFVLNEQLFFSDGIHMYRRDFSF